MLLYLRNKIIKASTALIVLIPSKRLTVRLEIVIVSWPLLDEGI